MPECSHLIYGLEKINQLIDLCIDCELYDEVNDIIGLSTNAQKYIDELCESQGTKSLEAFGLEKFEFPVEVIKITPSIISSEAIQASLLFRAEKPLYPLKNEAGIKPKPLLKNWSDLFWAKRIRAELLCHNKDTWNNRYEDLLTFLDSRIPVSKSEEPKSEGPKSENQPDFILTKFNYLMEQSAVATSEASYGYAERARILLEKLYPPNPHNSKRAPYDRWIWWNMGMAYQHMVGRNQQAVLEFNRVIKEFFNQASTPKEKKKLIYENGSNFLEFLLNILPAILQRAAINLKQQLGYHALQTLADSDSLLENVPPNYAETIYSAAASNLRQRINFIRLEAYQQLDSRKEENNLLENIYEKVFNVKLDINEPSLPPNDDKNSSIARTKIVEHLVSWFLERSRREESCKKLIGEMNNLIENHGVHPTEDTIEEANKLVRDIKKSADYLCKSIKTVTDLYWTWVKDNNQDKLIFFSRWAQFLKRGVSVSSSCKLSKFNKIKFSPSLNAEIEKISQELKEVGERLLNVTIELYMRHREILPIIESGREGKKTFELERSRSDDLPDFVAGLKSFYENMSIYFSDKTAITPAAFQNSRKGAITLLKDGHLQLLAALDEYHEQFGENQQIHALKRCDERLIWARLNGKDDPRKGCKNCLGGKKSAFSPESFDGLLPCQEEIPRDQEQNRFELLCYDYETIMQETEGHLTEYLARHSLHHPQQTLRFIGLQRWNSLTPAQGKSVGGGYFIYRTDSDGEVDLGIAIDPGFDYVRNLFRMGFSLMDVDIVLISHAHPDHLWDFESMVQLLHELQVKTHKIHQLNVVLTLGSYHRLSHIINNPGLRRFINPLVIDIRKEIEPDFFKKLAPPKKNKTPQDQGQKLNLLNYCFSFSPKVKDEKIVGWQSNLPGDENDDSNMEGEIEIWPTRAYHEDYSEISDSFGFLIKIREQGSSETDDKQFCFGYTGDTKWVSKDLYNQGCPNAEPTCQEVSKDLYNQGCPNDEPTCQEKCHKDKEAPRWKDVASQYADCDVLLMHLGSLINHKKKDEDHFKDYPNAEKCEALIRSKNHPYLMGMIRFLREIYKEPRKDKLILMGEFGEELRGGIRTDIVKRLQQGLTRDWQIVPVDVGLDILLHSYAEGDQPIGKFEFLCALCDKHRPLSEIDYFRFGQDEAIFYICKTCKKATPADVRQTRLGQLYEIGRELRTFSQKAR